MKTPKKEIESSKKVLVWGAGGHAKVVVDLLRTNGFDVAGFIDDQNPTREGELYCGARISVDVDCSDPSRSRNVVIAIGDNSAREQKALLAKSKGFKLISAIHPRATIARDVEIGAGVVVMAGAVINSGAVVGDGAIINTCAIVEHDCVIGDWVHISPGARIAGGVRIGKLAWIGIGATIIERINVGEKATAGAGAVLIRDVPPGMTVAGVPATELRLRRSL